MAHLNAELGIGEIARRLLSLLVASGVRVNPVGIEYNQSRNNHFTAVKNLPYKTGHGVISCVNPDQLATVIAALNLSWDVPLYHLGFWSWELENFPRIFRPAQDLVDEIWTVSQHSRTGIVSEIKDILVKVVPIPAPIPIREMGWKKRDFGVPSDSFLVLGVFDFFSDFQRKNPIGLIRAFRKAFPSTGRAVLLIKSINGESFNAERSSLVEESQGRPDIILADKYMSSSELLGLIQVADLYASLHRSEGYGINLIDAMARSTAVLATGYSGNLEFMNSQNSFLVPYELKQTRRYSGYGVNSVWAEPDLDFAAAKIRMLYNEPAHLNKVALSGFRHVSEYHSLSASVQKFRREFTL